MAAEPTMKHCVESYLAHIRALIWSIDDAETRVARCASRLHLLGVDPAKGATPAAPALEHGDDAISESIMRLQELRCELAAELAHGAGEIDQAQRICSRRYPTRYLLWLHYVQGMTWSKAARALGYSESHAKHKIASAGIMEVYGLMPERWRRDPIPNACVGWNDR